MPRIGLDTAASMKETMNVWRPKVSFLVTFPQAEIGLPSAPAKRGPEVAAEDLCGNTETAGACVDKKLLFRDRILEKDEAVESIELPTAAT